MRNGDPTDAELSAAVQALEDAGGVRAEAARILGLPRKTLVGRLNQAIARGLGHRPPDSPNAPNGMTPTGVSILSNAEGEVQRWEKFKADDFNRQAVIEETVLAFTEPLKGLSQPGKIPTKLNSHLKTEYILTDLHLGMYAWGAESGADYDTDLAVSIAQSAVDRLVDASPASDTCLLNQLGDFFHADSNLPMTPTGKNILDVDTRFRKVISSGVQLMRYSIERMLTKHKIVEVRNTPGNHDIHSSIIIDEAIKAYYHNTKRVIVHESPRAFWAYRFGKNLVGVAHGHAPKPKALPGLLAADYPEWWAVCPYKFCRHGHLHTNSEFEDMTVIVNGFRTLAAPDSWTSSMGYRSGREATSITLHDEDGQDERHYKGVIYG